MGLKQQPKCKDKTCRFCSGKYCTILKQKPEGKCPFKKERKTSAERDREEYYRAKENHLCVQCHKQDAYTLSGQVRCYECSQKNKERCKKNHCKNREKEKIQKKRKYDESEAQGLCVTCNKRKAIDGFKQCPICRGKGRKRYRAWADKNGIVPREDFDYSNLCYTCHKGTQLEGKKLCASCYEKVCKALEKARIAASTVKSSNSYYLFGFERNYYEDGQKQGAQRR